MGKEIDQVVHEDVCQDAYRRGHDYLMRWGGCAPTVFAAIMDALGYAEDPLVAEVWKATIGLTGGTGNMAIGTCGAMAGAAAAISLSFGRNQEEVEQDNELVTLINQAVAEAGKLMKEEFGHIVCQEVQLHNWGKAYHFEDPAAIREFRQMAMNDKGKTTCPQVAGSLARIGAGIILKYNPQYLRPSTL